MSINQVDFYELCLDEGGDFYTEIYGLEKEDFNQWVRDNLQEIGTVNSYNEVVPSNEVLNGITELGYEHIHYQCHYSAKASTIKDSNFTYNTGFVIRNSFHYPIITHSFNTVNGNIIDFLRIEDAEDPFNEENDSLPHTYYGIEIPREFILNYEQETLEEKSMKPLLYEWFLHNN
tara:strand:+ start:911 stop:1435 length:525 start_codon:yes stop_codon:yes gene_type:complete